MTDQKQQAPEDARCPDCDCQIASDWWCSFCEDFKEPKQQAEETPKPLVSEQTFEEWWAGRIEHFGGSLTNLEACYTHTALAKEAWNAAKGVKA